MVVLRPSEVRGAAVTVASSVAGEPHHCWRRQRSCCAYGRHGCAGKATNGLSDRGDERRDGEAQGKARDPRRFREVAMKFARRA